MKPQLYVDKESLIEFKNKMELKKKARKSDKGIGTTCTRHIDVVPMFLTKRGYECFTCINNKLYEKYKKE